MDQEKQAIVNILEHRDLNKKRIRNVLQIDEEDLNPILTELEQEGSIYLNSDNEYQLITKDNNLLFGTIKMNKQKQLCVSTIKKTYIIPNEFLNGALDGDDVVLRIYNDGKNIGKVLKIVKRNNGKIIFDYCNGKLIPYNWPINLNIYLSKKDKRTLVNGSRVLIKVSLEKKFNKYNGQIVSIVGHKNDPALDIKTLISTQGIVIDFSKPAIKQASEIKNYVTPTEIEQRIKQGGLDLRNKNIFTIDGENTKDIDDAVSIEKLDNGNYLLGVHIADVSYYVKEDTPLDMEARQRSTSIYPYNSAINMLPHALANGICSLNPHEDRLALSCIMEIDSNGSIINYKIIDTIINSKIQMTYEKVNDILEKNIIDEKYKPFIDDLYLMEELSNILEKRKSSRGYINFGESEITFKDQDGKAIEIHKYIRGTSQKIIENFMLAANESVSSYYYWLDLPGIYRNHPSPNRDSVQEIIDMLNLKIHVPKTIQNPHTIQNIVNIIQKYDKENIYTNLLLKSMKRAYYSPNNIGHYGLALENYTHFTSPIRRYPDLETHRIVRQIRDNIMTIDTEKVYNKLKEICINASIKERAADKIEKMARYYKIAEYMENHLNEYFIANIAYIGKKGISVKTQNGIKGKLNFELLKNMGYHYNSDKKILINHETDEILYIGDEIKVLSVSANKELSKIEFQFIEKTNTDKPKTKQLKK